MATDKTPLSYSQAITYIWIGQAMIGMLPWNGGDSEIQNLIRTGNVSYELLRPINLYNQWFCRAFALRTAPYCSPCHTYVHNNIIFITKRIWDDVSTHFWSIYWMDNYHLWGALMISCTITNIINICTLWSLSGDGITRLLSAIITFTSGMIVPLPLFPDWLKNILKILPFSGLVDIPIRFYTGGDIPINEIYKYFIFQTTWAIILYGFGQWLLNRKLKDIIVQGGDKYEWI